MAESNVLVLGCGSGGGSVALQLVMSGIRRITLVDKDVLEEENLIRHVCGARYLGMPKVEAVADLLLDRNPSADISKYELDLMSDSRLARLINDADVVVLATDNEPSRWLVNELCVRTSTPFCVARVFTRGIGGEVFSYRPGVGGCLACLETVLQRTDFRSGIREVDLMSEPEREEIYGLAPAEIKDSPGLNVDISFITAFHTRLTLEAIARLLPERPKYLSEIAENYIVWGNRPERPFTKNFQLQRLTLSPQHGCRVCAEREADVAL